MPLFNQKKKKKPLSFESVQKKKYLLENGSLLLEELITTFNGRQQIPIRSYTAEEIVTATNKFAHLVCEMLEGGMYKGFINERQFLVKKVRYEPEGPKKIIRDIAITSQMSQLKNVLKLSGCCLEFRYPAMVYEYVEFETLNNLLHNNDTLLPWRKRIKIALDIASTVLYLHTSFQTPIIHRNIKPSNVVIDQNGVAKLFDFSFSISLPPGESQVEARVTGTISFLDPQYYRSKFVTQKSDVYGFGILLLELITGKKHIERNLEDGGRTLIVDFVKDHIEKDQLSQAIDPKIVDQGFDDQQHLLAILDLGMRCTRDTGEERPEMIDVARELRQINKSVNR